MTARRLPHLAARWLVRISSSLASSTVLLVLRCRSRVCAYKHCGCIFTVGCRWNYGESSGMVYPCTPSQRCLGGCFSTCSPGYQGDFCSQCVNDYYELSDVPANRRRLLRSCSPFRYCRCFSRGESREIFTVCMLQSRFVLLLLFALFAPDHLVRCRLPPQQLSVRSAFTIYALHGTY